MCTDATRQEIAFLISLLRSEKPLSRLEVARNLPSEIKQLDWPRFLADEPRSIDELFENAYRLKTVSKTGPFSWELNEAGRTRLQNLIDRFIPQDERQKLRDSLRVPA